MDLAWLDFEDSKPLSFTGLLLDVATDSINELLIPCVDVAVEPCLYWVHTFVNRHEVAFDYLCEEQFMMFTNHLDDV